MSDESFDLLINNVRIVRPKQTTIERQDIAVKDGKFVRVAAAIDAPAGTPVYDARGQLGFPGAIDAHTHIGIYQPPAVYAPTESAAAASGGVTTLITYVRTGSLYLNMGGSLREFWPELLRQSDGNYFVDYGYHVSPIQGLQIGEMEYLLTECGAPNYGEVFMFYGLHGLHGRSDQQHDWLMLDDGDHYDVAHFDFICREAARLERSYPDLAPYIAVSFHCETPEILRAYETKVRREDKLAGLEAYSAARPPHSEAIAIAMVGAMAHAAGLQHVNILHITSREAMEAALAARASYPDIDFGLEMTAGHLLLDFTNEQGALAKVNPPLRSPDDRAYLWDRVLDGTVQWLITDHANCPLPQKVDPEDPENVWKAKAGFGGTEYLLSGLFSEGRKRGLTENRIAELLCFTPAQRFGLWSKGDIAPGLDADLVLFDPDHTWTIRAEDSPSAQGYTPFEGIEVSGRVRQTFLRGQLVYDNGTFPGSPIGKYISRKVRR